MIPAPRRRRQGDRVRGYLIRGSVGASGRRTCAVGAAALRSLSTLGPRALRMAIQTAMIVSTTYDVQGRRGRQDRAAARGTTRPAPTTAHGILCALMSL